MVVLLFYKYVPIADPAAFTEAHRAWCLSLGLKGRVLIAEEGINGTVVGTREAADRYIAALHADERFADMEFKESAGDASTFPKLVVKHRPEIVALKADIPLQADLDNHLSPQEWHAALEEEEVVVIDVRNRYEYDVGRFEGAIPCEIDHFRELPAYLEALEPYKERKVLMYCTGGIRCEKASALFRAKGFQQVFQLHGGIANYQKAFGNTRWLGECFVFDQRMTLKVEEGLVRVGRCAHTGRTTSRFVNCLHDPCHALFLLAPESEEENPDRRLCPQCLQAGLTSQSAEYQR